MSLSFFFSLFLLTEEEATSRLSLDGKLELFVAYCKLYSCINRNVSAFQVRSLFVSSANRAILYGKFECSPLDSVNIVTSSPLLIRACIDPNCTMHDSDFVTYLGMG